MARFLFGNPRLLRNFTILLTTIGTLTWFVLMGCAQSGPDTPASSTNDGRRYTGAFEGVTGRVLASHGHPVVNALVQAKSLDTPSQPIPEIAIVTDGDGRYRWPLRPGRYVISVSAGGYQTASQHIELRKGAAATLDFTLKPGS
jgi:hypothetical protein